MSALPPKADMCGALAYVRYGPIADIHMRRVQPAPQVVLAQQAGYGPLIFDRFERYAGLRQTEGAKDIAITLAIMSVYQWRGTFDPRDGIVRLKLTRHCHSCSGFLGKI